MVSEQRLHKATGGVSLEEAGGPLQFLTGVSSKLE